MECLFCNFINSKRTKHIIFSTSEDSNYPIITLFENNDAYAFLSIPDNEGESHLLIIPKEHYEYIEEIPKEKLLSIMSEVSSVTGILRKKYGGCKIILNDGESADQHIPHVHFHLVPKKENKESVWSNLSVEEFKKISGELRELFHQA